jgi:hypothetical protein
MLPILAHAENDGVTFALDPVTRRQVEADYPDALRSPRIFLGGPTNLAEIPGIDGDPRRRCKIIANLLTGIPESELPLLSFLKYTRDGDEELLLVDCTSQS